MTSNKGWLLLFASVVTLTMWLIINVSFEL